MDHADFGTGEWLAYCGQCPVPEVGNVFRRAGIPFRSVSGHLRQESAWRRIEQWVHAAAVRGRLRHARHGLIGHLYPGMLDVSTDLTLISTQLRLARGGARDRRPPCPGRGGHRRRGRRPPRARPRALHARRERRRGRLRLGSEGVGRPRPAGRGLRPRLRRLLPPGTERRAARAPRRGHDPGLVAPHRPRHPDGGRVRAAHHPSPRSPRSDRRRRFLHRDPGPELRRRRGRDGPRRPGPPRGERSGPAAAWAGRLPRQARLGGQRRVRRPGRTRHARSASGRTATARWSSSPPRATVVPGPLLAIGNTTSRVDFGCDPGRVGRRVEQRPASGTTGRCAWAIAPGDFKAAASLLGVDHRHVEVR